MLPTDPDARQWANFHTVGHCICLVCITQQAVCIIFSAISWKIYDLVSNTLANNLIILPSHHKVFMALCPSTISHDTDFSLLPSFHLYFFQKKNFFSYWYTGLFISPSGISELDCATTKTDTAERSISIGRESLQVFFLY